MITDVAMPGMTGPKSRSCLRGPPDLLILLVSGYSDTDAVERVTGSQAMILREPFLMSDLQLARSKVVEYKLGKKR